ncbi:hypothetical protein [Demequina aurantiaca]|uniref:hypothetical protein n=1 Tax=Demequina aurantiaca TaxID=676200 RepID=UPI003D352C8D
MKWPETDRDLSTVGSIAEREHAAVARIFLPVPGASGPTSWSSIAADAGIELAAQTPWSELAETGLPNARGLQSPYGEVDESVVKVLTQLLPAHTESRELYAVLSPMRDDAVPAGFDFTRIPWSDGRTRWHDGHHLIARIGFEDLHLFTEQENRQFPVALIPGDLGFMVGCAAYSDSLIVSGSNDLVRDLAATDLEWLPTTRSAPLPVEYLPQ